MIEYNPLAKVPRIDSPSFLDFVRTCPCDVTDLPGVVPHHEPFWNGSTGRKASDIFTSPLIPKLHNQSNLSIHSLNWQRFEQVHNINIMYKMLKRLEYFIAMGGEF